MSKNVEMAIQDEATKPKNFKRSSVSVGIGLFSGLFAIFLLYLDFSTNSTSTEFWSVMQTVLVSLVISFLFLSPWKRVNFLVSGVLILILGIWICINSYSQGTIDFWSVIWSAGCFIGGISLSLRFFDLTLFKLINKVGQTKPVRLTGRVIFWGVVAGLGLILLGSLISFVAGLSAVTIIIILLVLILLK